MKKNPHAIYYHAMLLPGVVMLLIFSVVPMFGAVIAFQDFMPLRGIFRSPFVGLYNFSLMFVFPDSRQVIFNTIIIAVIKIVLNLVVPIAFALLLNECRVKWFKRTLQTIVYLPNFLSWVIMAVIVGNVFSTNGIVNQALKLFGQQDATLFMVNNTWFRPIVVFSDIWKNFGFGAVVYISAITGIDTNMYEASDIDGANRLQKIRFITIPGIMSTVLVMATLSLGNVLNAGFDQIFNMYSPLVYRTGDIIDTYVFRVGLQKQQYSLGTAVGLFKSAISFILILVSYFIAYRTTGYRVF